MKTIRKILIIFWGINSSITGFGLMLWILSPEEKFDFLLSFIAFTVSVITFITLVYAKNK